MTALSGCSGRICAVVPDNLIVERAEAARTITFESVNSLPPDLQPADLVSIQGFQSIAKTSRQLRKILLQILRSGAHIWDETDSHQLSEEECSLLLNLLMVQESMEAKQNKQRHQEGVAQAKNNGKYAGRKKMQSIQICSAKSPRIPQP